MICKTFCLLTLFSMALGILQANPKETAAKLDEITAYVPYCGVECLYVILKMVNPDTDIKGLLRPEFISSSEGSSLLDLKTAAISFGMSAEVFAKFECSDIKALSVPVILHVKSEPEKSKYDHYWLYTGMRDGKACIFDPPTRLETIPYYEVARRWDGTGLLVSPTPIELSRILAPARKRFAIFAGVLLAAIVLIRIAGSYLLRRVETISRPIRLGVSVVQTAGLVMVALFVGMTYHFVNDAGFLAHAGVTEPIIKANLGKFIPKVTAKDIVANSATAVIIDARRMLDYDAGHIEGAINIPTTLCAEGRIAKLADIEKSRRLVIYCQSAGCPYAEKVAGHLKEDGFNNLAIYKGGWVDWEQRSKQ
ncbi:MAG: hypothetical protein LLF76_04075 [Planctomycetaceae bacterium]|nr:hypothetical protein [Planctomycetaceae bacterium]